MYVKTLPTPEPNIGPGTLDLYADGPKGLTFRRIVGFDLEAHLITRGRSTPRLVVATMAGPGPMPDWVRALAEGSEDALVYEERCPYLDEQSWGALWGRSLAERAMALMLGWAEVISGVNLAFDATTSAANYPDLLESWAIAYAEGRCTDASLRETLLSIGTGRLRFDARLPTAQKEGTANPRYGLAQLVMANFGVDLSGEKSSTKDPAAYADHLPSVGSDEPWRLRYCQLDGIPIRSWPARAVEYAVEDAAWSWRVICKQVLPNEGVTSEDYDAISTDLGGVVDEVRQARAAFALSLIAAWGPRADAERVALWDAEVTPYVDIAQALGRGNLPGAQEAIRALREPLEAALAAADTDPARHAAEEALEDFDETFGAVLDLDLYPGVPWIRTVVKKDGTKHKDDGTGDKKALMGRVAAAYRTRGVSPPLTEKGQERARDGATDETLLGYVSTAEDTLVESGDVLLVAFAACMSAVKMKNQYVPLLWQAVNAPFTTYFNALMATGRTSGSDGMQQPPRKGRYRESFVARPGKVLASVDYSQVELCALGQLWLWLFGESDMADAINAGLDLHVVFGLLYDKLAAALDAEGFEADDFEGRYARAMQAKENKKDPLAKILKDARQWAKAGNFGFGGGMGAKAQVVAAKASYGVILTEEQAEIQKGSWVSRWRQAALWFSRASTLTKNHNRETTVRHYVSGRVRAACDYSTSMNTLFQGLTADGAKMAMFALICVCYLGPDSPATKTTFAPLGLDPADFGVLWGVRIWNFIHDEFLYEGDAATGHLWAPAASRIQVAAMKVFIPDVAIEAPPALMTRWLKAAEPKYDADGKLVPWDS